MIRLWINIFVYRKHLFPLTNEFRHGQSSIPKPATFTFAIAFIHFRIYYCNSFFMVFQSKNYVDRIVTYTSRSLRISLILKSLHWVLGEYRTNF